MRTEILEQMRKKVSADEPISVGIARVINGTLHFSASDDLTFVYHTSRFSHFNQIGGLLPLDDADAALLEIARAGLPKNKWFIAGVCGTDPFRLFDKFLEEIKDAGFVGVQNFPTLGMMDGTFRAHLEQNQTGYGKEVEMIHAAHALGLLTLPLVFNADEAVQMTKAGADILVIHPGAKAFRKEFLWDDFTGPAKKIAEKARGARREIITLRHVDARKLVGI